MIKKSELLNAIECVAPPRLAAEWDNSGMQIELASNEIEKILIALEITPDVVSEAKAGGYGLIIVHHPLFFGSEGAGAKSRNILQSDPVGRYLWRLLTEPPKPTGVYAAHTSFDAAEGGLCEEMRRMIGLTPCDNEPDPNIASEFPHLAPFVRVGRFQEPLDFGEAFARVGIAFGKDADIRMSGSPAGNLQKTMVVCGGGGEAISFAVKSGCSLLVTGDIRQHEWRLAEAEGLALIDAGHYFTERPFAVLFAERLAEELGSACANIIIDVSTAIRRPYESLSG